MDDIGIKKMQKGITRFSELVFEVLEGYTGPMLSKETVEALLNTDNDTCKEDSGIPMSCDTATGYPQYPLHLKLSEELQQWMRHGKSVLINEKANLELLEENVDSNKEETRKLVDIKLKLLMETWESVSFPQKKKGILEILESLQLRGILDLIGMRQTVGSIDIFPPPLSVLWKSFKENHKPNSKLSRGARALSKHCHRDSTCQWWGISTGSESEKNKHAERVLEKILGDAAWINIHMLPHDLKILEVRNQLGYGARWLSDGSAFRGFLEPQMQDGHTIGWRH